MSAKTPSLLKPPRDASIYLPPLPLLCTSPFPCSVPALLPSAFHQVNNIAPSALYIFLHPPPRSTLPSAVWQRRKAPCNRNVCISPPLSLLQLALSIVHPSTPPAGPVSSCVHCLGSPSLTRPGIIRHNSVMNGHFKRISRWQKQAIIPLKKAPSPFSF